MYEFSEVWAVGNAHFAVLSDTTDDAFVHMKELWGDRSAVWHIARNQNVTVDDFNVYIPLNFMAYK